MPNGQFRYIKGSAKLLTSSDKAKRWFCEDCGTPLVCIANDRTDVVDITIGSLDNPEQFPPKLQIWYDTRLPWVHDDTKEHDMAH